MSKRITRDLSDLRRGAELLAAGDLGTRVPVRSRDEVGHLAVAFNNMAEELCENQRKLIEEERLRKEQEMERRLLETENARKSEELEEARRFQLSLLPALGAMHRAPFKAVLTHGFVLDERALVNSRILPYAQMVASVIEGRTISRDELIAALRKSMRQRSIGRWPRREYVLRYLNQHPP